MECNRDEAAKAKELAEKKFMAKDTMGAKKFALKAQRLFPGIEGILPMLTTLDVYISAENTFNGEIDFYGVLGVDSRADEDTVRRQYRKLALVLHPDKNKSIGAEGAFKLISEAWSLLSDKARRTVYDQKRNVKATKDVSNPSKGSSAHPGSFDSYSFAKCATPNERMQKDKKRCPHPPADASPRKPKSTTFWTVCRLCKIQYEYLRVYLNLHLLCPNCHKPFLARETSPPPCNGSNFTIENFTQLKRNSSHQAAGCVGVGKEWNNKSTDVGTGGSNNLGEHNESSFQWAPFSRMPSASTVAHGASMVQQAYAKGKREREKAEAATKREEGLLRKLHTSNKIGAAASSGRSGGTKRKRSTDCLSTESHKRSLTSQLGLGNGTGNGRNAGWSRVSENTKPKDGILTLLVDKAKKEIRKELNKLSSVTLAANAHKEQDENEDPNENLDKSLVTTSTESFDAKSGGYSKNSSLGNYGVNMDVQSLETMSIPVLDSEFHNFDRNRNERDIEKNQVWAAYDDADGMPRYYAMIHSRISSCPFKVRISWLNSKTSTERGGWIGRGLKTCGAFRIGRYENYNSINSFSHKVRWTEDKLGAICIYPSKGEVWALYKNWSPDWSELTTDEVVRKYEMVEILENYDDELGVTVIPLIKVASFKAVFHPHLDSREIRKISREEMFRFSHRVPSYLIRGHEAPNAPKGCRELDPAAAPPELLEVIEDCNGD